MNGPQDVGGRHGFGPVVPEDESIRFHAEWEKRVLGVTLASAALGLLEHRRLPPRPRKPATRDLLRCQLLRDLAPRVGGAVWSAQERFRRRNSPYGQGDRARPAHRPQDAGGCGSGGSGQGRPDRTARPGPPLRHGRPGAHAQPPAEGAHQAARIRPGPGGDRHRPAWLSRLSRHQRPFRRGAALPALHRDVSTRRSSSAGMPIRP
jgi:hypothetical protein